MSFICEECLTDMKPLFTSYYCPRCEDDGSTTVDNNVQYYATTVSTKKWMLGEIIMEGRFCSQNKEKVREVSIFDTFVRVKPLGKFEQISDDLFKMSGGFQILEIIPVKK